jgi:BolA family transcriptional regulator, general stress-responsive regulator
VTVDRVALIRSRLESALEPSTIEVIDDSHRHAGHAGARDGRGHFRVAIVSSRFAGLRPIERHQLVHAALADLMSTDIHALSISAKAPDEAASR